jgi:hypothetical protein
MAACFIGLLDVLYIKNNKLNSFPKLTRVLFARFCFNRELAETNVFPKFENENVLY